jgi:hypothetical protein
MPIFECEKCKKNFNRKSNYDYHINNKKRPCTTIINIKYNDIDDDKQSLSFETPKISTLIEDDVKNVNNNILFNKIDKLINPIQKIDNPENICIYCEAKFTKSNNLQRHIKSRCKSKIYYDELEILKQKLQISISEINLLKKENEELKHKGNNQNATNNIINNTTNHNTLNKNQINNGVINNNLNVQLVQFGNENIDELDIKEALNIYLKSTGGNIVSNMLKFVNLNDKYPQNHNICMSDLSRELVKIFNGEKFVIKKFKNIKGDILGKVINNTHKIVNKIEHSDNIKKTPDLKSKIKINNVSIKLMDDCPAEDIVREEIREKEKLFLTNENINNKKGKIIIIEVPENDYNDNKNKSNLKEEVEERDFTPEEIIRIEHLENKRDGLQEIAYEKIKDELYNGKNFIEKQKLIVK